MKIDYITNARMPTEKAHGYQIIKMCEAFLEVGAKITLIIPALKNEIQESPFIFYNVKPNFDIRKLPIFDFYLLAWLPLSISFRLNSIAFMLSALMHRPARDTIIFTRSPEIAGLFSRLGYRTIFECHQLPESLSRLYYFSIKKVSLIITITQSLKNDLTIKSNFPPNKIFVEPDGVDLNTFDIDISKEQARKELDLPINKKIVVYTGQLLEWKGVDTLARASASLAENDTVVYFVGGRPKDIASFRSKYPKANFKNVSNVARDKVAVWLKAADVLVIPNTAKQAISERHTSPLKLFEYMASGTPIVASDLPSLREVLNEKICYFSKPDDELDLVRAINESLLNPENSKAKSHQAKSFVRNYTWHKRAENITARFKMT